MSLVPSLLQAIVHVNGEALVLHAGDKPYVVAPAGQIELASGGLTLEAVSGIVAQLLPMEFQHALDEFGAAQYELPCLAEFPGEQFTVVVARGGDDVWAEIRRRKVPDDDRIPEQTFGSAAVPRQEPLPEQVVRVLGDEGLALPDETRVRESAESADVNLSKPVESTLTSEPIESKLIEVPPPVHEIPPSAAQVPAASWLPPPPSFTPKPLVSAPAVPTPVKSPSVVPPPHAAPSHVMPPEVAAPAITPSAVVPPPAPTPAPPAAISPAPPPPRQPSPGPGSMAQPAVVLPMTRSPIRSDTPPPLVTPAFGLDRLLRIAAARSASTLYLSSQARPSVRVDGEIQMLEGEPLLGPNEVESLLLTLVPERNHEALRTGVATEWISDLDGVGRVRCMSFRDHRGPGGVFRMMPVRAVSSEQLGLSRQIQSLAMEPEGLVLIAGPRQSGKRTLISAFVDLINRTRSDRVITIESEINVMHERGTSSVSQREVRGSDDEVLVVVRAALREDPDVLVVESLRTAALISVAIEAAASGQLVIGGFPSHTATDAIDRIINLYPPEHRRQVQLALAENLRGVVAQVLLLKSGGGGRLAAREVLLNTPAVASVIAEGRTSQLPMAIEGGRMHGMAPLNDALVGLVQSGAVDVREAYRHAADRTGFLELLKRQGIDTSVLERLA